MTSARDMGRSSRANAATMESSDRGCSGSQRETAAIDIPGKTESESLWTGGYNQQIHMQQSLNAMEQRMSLSRSRGRPGSSVPTHVLQTQNDDADSTAYHHHTAAQPAQPRAVIIENSWSTPSPAANAAQCNYPETAYANYAGEGYSYNSSFHATAPMGSAATLGRGESTPYTEDTSRRPAATAYSGARRQLVTPDDHHATAAARRGVFAEWQVEAQYQGNFPNGTYYDRVAVEAGACPRDSTAEYWEGRGGSGIGEGYAEGSREQGLEDEEDDEDDDDDDDGGDRRTSGEDDGLQFACDLDLN